MTASLIVILIFLLLLSAIFSGSETALFSLSPMKVRAFKSDQSRGKRLAARLVSKPRDLLVTLLMVNMAVNILVQNVVSGLFGTFSTLWLTVVVPLVLTLVFGEVIPKSVAMSANTKIARRMAPFLYFIQKLLGPLRRVVNAITGVISHFFFFFLRKGDDISLEDLQVAMRASGEHGILSKEETRLITGYLSLEEDVAKELMQHRGDMLRYDLSEPLETLYNLFVDQECSKIPITNGDPENLIGIFTTEAFFLHRDEIAVAADIKPFLKKPFYVPESIRARTLLDQFNHKGEEFAIVVDEYGSICGLITKEDLVEVVVGQIEDKRDEKELYTRSGTDVVIASGKLELDVFEEIFGIKLDSPTNMATVGGYLMEQIGDIPKSGSKHVTEHFLFYILSAGENRIRRVYIRFLGEKKRRGRGGK